MFRLSNNRCKEIMLSSQISGNKSNANGFSANRYVIIFTIFLSCNKTKNYQTYYENSLTDK